MKTKVIAIFGYNNTRIYDVLKIRQIAKDLKGVDVLLVKEGITESDLAVTPYCLDHAPDDARIASTLETYLNGRELELLGCLPFSDKGVVGAASAAEYFGVFGDDVSTAPAMLDKFLFRELEANIQVDSKNYKKPFFEKAWSKEAICALFVERGPFFIKPTSEGNSRGCMKIESVEDLDRWFSENPGAPEKGVICEEILALSEEYSFDGVDGSYWITKKFTTSGSYRAEYQHIVPAPLSGEVESRIHQVLRPFLKSIGSRGGAFHHEFFLLDDGRVGSVEPNRRPAGMWIWDLAGWSFDGFDPWEKWIQVCTGTSSTKSALKPSFFSGVRGVISERSGVLSKIDEAAIQSDLLREFGPDAVRFSKFKSVGDRIRSEPRDNSDFLAFIALKDPDYATLLEKLEKANRIFLRHTEVSPCV